MTSLFVSLVHLSLAAAALRPGTGCSSPDTLPGGAPLSHLRRSLNLMFHTSSQCFVSLVCKTSKIFLNLFFSIIIIIIIIIIIVKPLRFFPFLFLVQVMKYIFVWGCLLAVLMEPCMSDIYMHFPHGSNNRLNGNQANVKNANRLFDSQVNEKCND